MLYLARRCVNGEVCGSTMRDVVRQPCRPGRVRLRTPGKLLPLVPCRFRRQYYPVRPPAIAACTDVAIPQPRIAQNELTANESLQSLSGFRAACSERTPALSGTAASTRRHALSAAGQRDASLDKRVFLWPHWASLIAAPCERRDQRRRQIRPQAPQRRRRCSPLPSDSPGYRHDLKVNSIERRNTIQNRRFYGSALVEDVVE